MRHGAGPASGTVVVTTIGSNSGSEVGRYSGSGIGIGPAAGGVFGTGCEHRTGYSNDNKQPGVTLMSMSMVITFPDEAADRLRAAAVSRGVSVDEVAVDLVVEHLPAVDQTDRARAALQAFIGSVSGDGSRFDIHVARRELAQRRHAHGTRSL